MTHLAVANRLLASVFRTSLYLLHFAAKTCRMFSCVHAGRPSAQQLACIRTRKPAPPVLEVQMADGSVVPLWNTFSDQQVSVGGWVVDWVGGRVGGLFVWRGEVD